MSPASAALKKQSEIGDNEEQQSGRPVSRPAPADKLSRPEIFLAPARDPLFLFSLLFPFYRGRSMACILGSTGAALGRPPRWEEILREGFSHFWDYSWGVILSFGEEWWE